MEPILLTIIVGLGVVGFVVWRLSMPSLGGAIGQAQEADDVGPLVEAIDKLRPGARPAAYNHAIRRIWDSYERDLAIRLVKELARRHPEAMIAQYWLKQAMQVEPALARERLDGDFLKRYYQPEVAAACGPVG